MSFAFSKIKTPHSSFHPHHQQHQHGLNGTPLALTPGGLRSGLFAEQTSSSASAQFHDVSHIQPTPTLFTDSRTVVEVYTPYPSAVIEAMSDGVEFQGARADSESGIAWVGCIDGDGNLDKLYVWKCKTDAELSADSQFAVSSRPRSDEAIVYELNFSRDGDIQHFVSSRLICVISNNDGSYGLLVISETGWIRYWKDALDPSAGVAEAQIPLSVPSSASPSAETLCILVAPSTAKESGGWATVVTNAGTIFQIEVVVGAALNVTGPFSKPSGGVWAGISSILRFAGAVSGGADSNSSLPRAVVHVHENMYLLTEATLQKWNLWSRSKTEAFSWEVRLRDRVQRTLVDHFSRADQNIQVTSEDLSVWLCDMQMSSEGLIILAASTLSKPSPDEVPVMSYTLLLVGGSDVDVEVDVDPEDVMTLANMNFSPDYDRDNEYALLEEIKLEIPNGGPIVYVFTPSGIETVVLGGGNDNEEMGLEAKDISLPSISLVGAASIDDLAVVFPAFPESNLVVIAPAGGLRRKKKSRTTQPSARGNGRDNDTELVQKKKDLLSHAFNTYYYSHTHSHSHTVAPLTASADPNACVLVSLSILDERPASDIRWADGSAKSADDAVIIVRQLEEKKRRLSSFSEFIGRAKKLPVSGRWELLQNGEKIAAALGLREYYNQSKEKGMGKSKGKGKNTSASASASVGKLLNSAMEEAVRMRGSVDENGVMGPIDLFFIDLSRIEEVLLTLAEMVSASTSTSTMSMSMAIPKVKSSSDVLGLAGAVVAVLDAARAYRLSHCGLFSVPEWIAKAESIDSEGEGGGGDGDVPQSWASSEPILKVLTEMIDATKKCGEWTAEVWSLLMKLSDLYLDGLRRDAVSKSLQSIRNAGAGDAELNLSNAAQRAARKYEDAQETLIRPFMNGLESLKNKNKDVGIGEVDEDTKLRIDLARKLAIDHHHYEVLIELCYLFSDFQLLEEYAQRFSDDHFDVRLFQWLHTHSYLADLVSQPRKRWRALNAYLKDHPSLSWVQALQCEDYIQAGEILCEHSQDEAAHLARKKRLLSIAKLSVLASGIASAQQLLSRISDALYVINVQEFLAPSELAPLKPLELVEICMKGIHVQGKGGEDGDGEGEGEVVERDMSRVILAHEIVLKSGNAHEECIDVWKQTIDGDDWLGLADKKIKGSVDDNEVLAFIRGSLLYHALVFGPNLPETVFAVLEEAVGVVGVAEGGVRSIINAAVQLACEDRK